MRATRGPEVAERTAAVVWQMLRAIDRPIFLWNVFPLHPHEPGDPMSNRCHTRVERESCRPLLTWLMETLQPRTVVAIGRDAHLALQDLGISAAAVRHPSYGGQSEFVSGLTALYGLTAASNEPSGQTRLV
ncbi:MAG: uracil-DNA glycosylase [Alphaproteobacteria bacterium]